ncbi:unnamed protein product [Diabrotica balteata]|uniref:RNA-directed DNA polymerase n=1 Tax=Diabrotica balteata TaxID=107213 RepID=A0A9N9SV64_DIABA|nr:unnamed protein product [Diabrotica balteata]
METRRWKKSESFSAYFHDKLLLGNEAGVEDEDMIHYLIDGFDDRLLQNQAKMMLSTLNSTEDLYKLMGSVVKDEVSGSGQRFATASSYRVSSSQNQPHTATQGRMPVPVKCFNCGRTGHKVTECRQAKRDRGSCFRCGSKDHMVRDCPNRNQQVVQQVADSTTRDSNGAMGLVERPMSQTDPFVLNLVLDKYSITLNGIIDTGSPISLISENFVKAEDIISSTNLESYSGINKSPLKVLGFFYDTVIFDDISVNLKFYVVEKDSFSWNLLLGRDFINNESIENISFSNGSFKINKNSCVQTEEDYQFPFTDVLFINDMVNLDADLNINYCLPFEITTSVQTLLKSYYFDYDKPLKPQCDFKAQLILTKNEPFSIRPRRLSYAEKKSLDEILANLLENNVIRESDSPFCSPVVLTKKKSNEYRMCVDYRTLNKYLIRDQFPLPLIDDHLDRLKNKKYFSKLDLKNAFYHVPLDESCTKYTSFVTPSGQYEFLKLPFGLSSSPSIFARFVNKIFKDLCQQGNVLIYFDDILIATQTIEENLEVLREVLILVSQNLLELRLDKCSFLKTEIDFLGYRINENGICPNKDNVKAIAEYPVPTDTKQVHRFLGLASYFRRFIQNFSIIAKPLYDLLRKNVKFEFTMTHLQAFENLKSKLTSEPILAVYDPSRETELHCDASQVGYGSILLQKQSDDKFHPVFFFSKRTTDYESRYHSYELECLSIVYALKRFHVYLQGIPFKIVTDCDSFRLTMSKKDIIPRIMRWCLLLQNYDYSIEHRVNTRMQHVDALSRVSYVLVLEGNTIEQTLALKQSKDTVISDLRKRLEETDHPFFELRNGLVYRKLKDNIAFYVPESMESAVIYHYHNELGHFGTDKTFEIISKTYWFPKLKFKIGNHIQNCLKCIEFNPKSGKSEGYLHSIPKGNLPFEMLHIDHYGPLAPFNKNKYIFEVVDGFTKFIKFYPCKSTNTGEVIKYLTEHFANYSVPSVISSDRGSCFTSHDFKKFLEEYTIKHILIASGCPRANGQIERMNRLLTPLLAKITDEKQINWPNALHEVEFCINNTINRSTGETPAKLLFGRDQIGKIRDNLREALQDIDKEERDLEMIRTKAETQIIKAQNVNEQYYNKKHKEAQKFKVGQYVMISNVDTTPGVAKKLIPKFRGPYEIVKELPNDRYIVNDIVGFQTTQVPYEGIIDSSRIRAYDK